MSCSCMANEGFDHVTISHVDMTCTEVSYLFVIDVSIYRGYDSFVKRLGHM